MQREHRRRDNGDEDGGRQADGLDAVPADSRRVQSRRGARRPDGPSPRSPWSPLLFIRTCSDLCTVTDSWQVPYSTCCLRDPAPHPGHRGSREADFRVRIPGLHSGEEGGFRDQRRGGCRRKREEPGVGRRVDAGGGDLEEQFDVLPATFLGPPVLLQLPRGHAGVGARAALGLWKHKHLRTSTSNPGPL